MREFESLYEFGDSKYCEKEEICVDMVRERSSCTGVANVVHTPIGNNSVFFQARTYLRTGKQTFWKWCYAFVLGLTTYLNGPEINLILELK